MENVVISDCGVSLLKNLVPGDMFKVNGKYYEVTDNRSMAEYLAVMAVCLNTGKVEWFDCNNYVKTVNELHIVPAKKFAERLSK